MAKAPPPPTKDSPDWVWKAMREIYHKRKKAQKMDKPKTATEVLRNIRECLDTIETALKEI